MLVAMYTDNTTGQLQLRSTEFAMPTDNIDVAKDGIVGTANGRIFLAFKNGALTEMKYQVRESECRSPLATTPTPAPTPTP